MTNYHQHYELLPGAERRAAQKYAKKLLRTVPALRDSGSTRLATGSAVRNAVGYFERHCLAHDCAHEVRLIPVICIKLATRRCEHQTTNLGVMSSNLFGRPR